MSSIYMALYKHSITLKKTIVVSVIIILASVFVGEVGIYYVYSWNWFWPDINPPKDSLKHMTRHTLLGRGKGEPIGSNIRYHFQNGNLHYYTTEGSHQQGPSRLLQILILSDPHIMCTYSKGEPWISRWDNDRYLAAGYSHLLSHLDPPDVIVFLGDLFSDGFRASTQHWSDYKKCFDAIFPRTSQKIQRLFILGDNDIGGEGPDLMTEETIGHARREFGNLNDIVAIKGVIMAKLATSCFINWVTRTKAETECKRELWKFLSQYETRYPPGQDQNISILPRIVFSHVPETTDNSLLLSSLRLHEKFNFIVSGHIHYESYSSFKTKKSSVARIAHEITVPTCSYRMGVAFPGVGAMVIGSNGDVSYQVLWLPPRYPFFVLYIIEIVMFLLLFSCLRQIRRCRTLK